MSRKLPPLNALRAFEAVARLGGVSRAADELCVTHGAVSRQIALLEDRLGVALFDRSQRIIALSRAGRHYFDDIRPALDDIASATARLTASQRRRTLVLNVVPTFAMRWLMPRLADLQGRLPDVSLHLVTTDRPLSATGGHFDIAIRRGPSPEPGMRSEAFLHEHELPVCSPALLAAHPVRHAADLQHHVLLHSDTRPGAWARWLSAAGEPGLAGARQQHFNHFYLALQAACDGLGFALGPFPLVNEDIECGRLVAPLDGPMVAAQPYCWYIAERDADDPVIRTCLAWLSTVAGPDGASS